MPCPRGPSNHALAPAGPGWGKYVKMLTVSYSRVAPLVVGPDKSVMGMSFLYYPDVPLGKELHVMKVHFREL